MVSFQAWAPWIIVLAIGLSPIYGFFVCLIIGRCFRRRPARRVVLANHGHLREILPRKKAVTHPIDEISEEITVSGVRGLLE